MGFFRNLKIRALAKKRLETSKSTRSKEIVPYCGFQPFEVHTYGDRPYVVDVSRGERMCPIIVWDSDNLTAQQRVQDIIRERGHRGYTSHSQPVYDGDY